MKHFALLGTILLCFPSVALSDNTMEIGVVVSEQAEVASEFLSGFKLAAEGIAANNGGSISTLYRTYSVNCDPVSFVQAAEHAIAAGADLVVELGCGGSTSATKSLLQETNIPHLVYRPSPIEDAPSIGMIEIENGDAATLQSLVKEFGNQNVALTEYSAAGATAAEIASELLSVSQQTGIFSFVGVIRDRHITTSFGDLTLSPDTNLSDGRISPLAYEIWAKKKDCPKCPKTGDCPQQLELFVSSIKACE